MDFKEATKILVTKVLFQTMDVFTDWLFAIRLIKGTTYDLQCSEYFAENHVYMGAATLIPPILSAFFHTHCWYHFEKVENGGSGRLKTILTVLLQVWPQYRYLKYFFGPLRFKIAQL